MTGPGSSRSIPQGAHFGTYEVIGVLGVGGMGEVYLARDTRLHREVALKFISASLSEDRDALARFEREARTLASVNHPNIAAIYGLEEFDGHRFLVLELVPGETLEERCATGPLNLEAALTIARQLAGALWAAHEKGVVHRDLKPANVKLTHSGTLKVLDFGLAKPMSTTDGATLATRPTTTQAGAVVGTLGYMSPEQARGQATDERTDVWAFGCILFEMLTGERAFPGDTVADAMSAIITREPDWKKLPPSTPADVRRLLRRCLEKDPERRIRDLGAVRIEIEAALARLQSPRISRGKMIGGVILAIIAVGVLVVIARNMISPSRRVQPTLTQVTFAEGTEEQPAWSPDGEQILYVATPTGSSQRKVFRKYMKSGAEGQLTNGLGDDLMPAWSPDGKRVLFVRSRQPDGKLQPGDVFGAYENGDIWSRDVATGAETLLVRDAYNPSFSPDGNQIAVDASWAGPRRIWVLDAEAHNPQQVTTETSEAVSHLAPRWSPDGKKIVFQNQERTKFDVRLVDVATKQIHTITDDISTNVQPVFSRSGKFIYFSSYRSGGLNIWRVAIRKDGERAGSLEQVTTGPGQDVEVAVSPDGQRLAFATLKQNADVWRLPVSPTTGMPTGQPQVVISSTREDSRGAWFPDGRDIAFNADRSGDMNIWLYSGRDGSVRQLTKGPGGDFQPSWAPDGKHIVFFSSRSGTPNIWQVDVGSGGLKQLTKTQSIDINPFYSPDGRWIAFQSDRSGRLELWVMSADGSGARQLSHEGVGGHFLRWDSAGDGVIFRCPTCEGTGATMEAPVDGGPSRVLVKSSGGSHISFSPDRSRIMDVVGHKTLTVSPVDGGKPEKVFEFTDPTVRIDYPVWSPEGHWVLFDRFLPQGGDVWVMEHFE